MLWSIKQVCDFSSIINSKPCISDVNKKNTYLSQQYSSNIHCGENKLESPIRWKGLGDRSRTVTSLECDGCLGIIFFFFKVSEWVHSKNSIKSKIPDLYFAATKLVKITLLWCWLLCYAKLYSKLKKCLSLSVTLICLSLRPCCGSSCCYPEHN